MFELSCFSLLITNSQSFTRQQLNKTTFPGFCKSIVLSFPLLRAWIARPKSKYKTLSNSEEKIFTINWNNYSSQQIPACSCFPDLNHTHIYEIIIKCDRLKAFIVFCILAILLVYLEEKSTDNTQWHWSSKTEQLLHSKVFSEILFAQADAKTSKGDSWGPKALTSILFIFTDLKNYKC